jgi:hypothetical protein
MQMIKLEEETSSKKGTERAAKARVGCVLWRERERNSDLSTLMRLLKR